MKATISINNLKEIEAAKYTFFVQFNGVEFPLEDADADDTDMVELELLNWQGKDTDGFNTYKVIGNGEGFTLSGTFYNADHYKTFCAALSA